MSGGRDWTRKEEDDAVAAALAGESIRGIAERTGRTYSAVSQKVSKKLRERGLGRTEPKRYKAGEFATLVARLARPGVSDGDVAKILGCYQSQVTTTRRKLGIPPGCRKHAKLMNPERRPPGHKWQPGELTACVTRLLALNSGMGVPLAEMGRLLNIEDAQMLRGIVSQLTRGIRDVMPPDAKAVPLPKPKRRVRYERFEWKDHRSVLRLDKLRRAAKRAHLSTEGNPDQSA